MKAPKVFYAIKDPDGDFYMTSKGRMTWRNEAQAKGSWISDNTGYTDGFSAGWKVPKWEDALREGYEIIQVELQGV